MEAARGKRGADAYTDLLLGVYRDVQQQSFRLAEQTRELVALKGDLQALSKASEQRDLTTREEFETTLRLKAREGTLALGQARTDDAKQLEELRTESRASAAKSAKELHALRLRLETLERRMGELLSDLQHERARLSEMRADHEGLQDKVVRSALNSAAARSRSRGALWVSLAALALALGTLGWIAWPLLRERL